MVVVTLLGSLQQCFWFLPLRRTWNSCKCRWPKPWSLSVILFMILFAFCYYSLIFIKNTAIPRTASHENTSLFSLYSEATRLCLLAFAPALSDLDWKRAIKMACDIRSCVPYRQGNSSHTYCLSQTCIEPQEGGKRTFTRYDKNADSGTFRLIFLLTSCTRNIQTGDFPSSSVGGFL